MTDARIPMTTHPKDRRWLGMSFLMSTGHFMCDIFPGILPPILPLLMVKYGFSITFAGMLGSLASFSNSFTQPLFGYLSDRIDRRFFVILGPILSGAFYSIIGYMTNKWTLVLCVMAGGMGVAMFHPQGAKIIYHTSGPAHKGKAMSIFTTGGSIGYPLGALVITSLIIPLWGLEAAPVMLIPAFILMTFMLKYTPRITNPNGIETGKPRYKPSVRQLSAISMFVGIGLVRSLVIMSFNVLIPIWYAQQHFPLQQGGYAIFIFHTLGGLGGLVGGFISDKVSAKTMIIWSFVFGTLFLIAFTTSGGGMLSLAWLGLAGAMLYASIPTVITQAQATLPEYMGTVSSMVMGFSWGVGGLLVIAVGGFADAYGVPQTMKALSYFPLIAVVAAMFIRTKRDAETKLPEYI